MNNEIIAIKTTNTLDKNGKIEVEVRFETENGEMVFNNLAQVYESGRNGGLKQWTTPWGERVMIVTNDVEFALDRFEGHYALTLFYGEQDNQAIYIELM